MSVHIRVEDRGLRESQRALRNIPGAFEKAVKRAANRAAAQGRTASSRLVREKYTVKAKDVRPALRVIKASSGLVATLHVSGSPLSLGKFRYSPRRDTTGKRRKLIRAEMVKGQRVGGLDKAFVYHGQIWTRTEGRFKIRRVSGSSVPRMMEKQHEGVEDIIREAFIKRLDHETKFILRRHNDRS